MITRSIGIRAFMIVVLFMMQSTYGIFNAVVNCVDDSLCPFSGPYDIAITPDGTKA